MRCTTPTAAAGTASPPEAAVARRGSHRPWARWADAYDNAMAGSFFATIEKELLARRTFRTRDEARRAIFDHIESFYNRRRRRSAIG